MDEFSISGGRQFMEATTMTSLDPLEFGVLKVFNGINTS
jgi:hypothetical protein